MSSDATAPKPITVVVVDDHPMVRDGLCALVESEPDLELLGETGSGQEALEIIPRLKPKVAIVDLMLPDIGGTEIIQRISAKSSDIAFIVLTSLVGDEEIYRALEAGARGYLFKDMARKELVQAIRMAVKGKRYLPAQVGSVLGQNFPRTGLSSREIEVLQFIATGMRNKEIAGQLGVSETTVNAHMKHILEKLNAFDRTSAVMTALRRGIIRL